MRFDRSRLLLYGITDRHWLCGKSLVDDVEKALRGGATCIQLREKGLHKIADEERLREAIAIRALCHQYDVPLIIDDDVALAIACKADGVHVGQQDEPVAQARRELGEAAIIGVSAHTVEEAVNAYQSGADYLGAGAVFATASKKDVTVMPKERLREICAAVPIPVVAIGGINAGNISQLKGTGIAGVAVISAIFGQDDIEKATQGLLLKVKEIV